MVTNRKGFIRTFEAVIAIILVLTTLWYFYQPSPKSQDKTPASVENSLKFILQEMSVNDTYRSCILTTGSGGCLDPSMNSCVMQQIFPFIQANTPPGYQNACEICDTAVPCIGYLPVTKEITTNSILIAGNPSKVIRVYFWQQ